MAILGCFRKTATTSKCQKWLTVVGCCMLAIPNGIFWYWGNMSVYCMSYFVTVVGSTFGVETAWVTSAFVIFWTLFVIVAGVLSKRIGALTTLLIGFILFDIGMVLSYFSVQSSLPALTLTLGVLSGLGTGVVDGASLLVVVEWSDNEVGLFTCMLQGSLSLGGIIINQMITQYVNPDNLSPEFHLGEAKYFTQKSVLDKVPSMFLIISCFSIGMHVLGFLLVKRKPTEEYIDTYKPTDNTSEKSSLKENYKIDALADMEKEYNTMVTETESKSSSEEDLKGTETKVDYTYQEVLKTKSFYALWIACFLSGLSYSMVSRYYKAFGQLWIDDDHFMADLATFISLSNAIMSSMYGLAMDNFGIKNCSIAFNSVLMIVLFFYYFTPMTNRWLYFFATIIYQCVGGPIFMCFTASTAILYGKKHFSANFSLIITAQLCFYVIAPFLLGPMISNLGWFITFAGTGALTLIGVFGIILFLPSL